MKLLWCLIAFMLCSPLACASNETPFSSCQNKNVDLNQKYSDDEFFKFAANIIDRKAFFIKRAALIDTVMLACLRKEYQALEEIYNREGLNKLNFRNESISVRCERQIQTLRESVKKEFPLMRMNLALSYTANRQMLPQTGDAGGNQYFGMPAAYYENPDRYIQDSQRLIPTVSMQTAFDVHIAHPYQHLSFFGPLTNPLGDFFQNTLSDLPPLTSDEIKAAVGELDAKRAEFDKVFFEDGGKFENLAVNDRHQYILANSAFFADLRAEHLKQYLNQVRNVAVIVYLSSSTPSDEELIGAVEKVANNAQRALKKIEKEFFVPTPEGLKISRRKMDGWQATVRGRRLARVFYGKEGALFHLMTSERPVNDVLKSQPEYCGLATQMLEKRSKWEFRSSLGMMGVIFGGVLACNAFSPVKNLCNVSFGIGLNASFFIYDEVAFSTYLNEVLIDPSGSWALHDWAGLDEKALTRFMSRLFLPIGTGLTH